jgi:uncharacterized protein YecT (DUF1311 family)
MRRFVLVVLFFPTVSAADETLTELERRTGLGPGQLREILANCRGPQPNQNICALRDSVVVDATMRSVVAQTLRSLSDTCKTMLQQRQMMWEAARDRYCKDEAGAGAPGGSTNDAIYTACHTAYTRERIAQLKTVTGCDRIPTAPTCEIGAPCPPH